MERESAHWDIWEARVVFPVAGRPHNTITSTLGLSIGVVGQRGGAGWRSDAVERSVVTLNPQREGESNFQVYGKRQGRNNNILGADAPHMLL